ncbi:transglycosylase SLT domain-containing protein [Paracoccus sp. p1-h21]
MYPLRRRFRRFSLMLALALAPALPAGAESAVALRDALAAAGRGDWVAAQQAAARSGALAQAVLTWRQLRAGQGDFDAYRGFLAAHPDWPDADTLRRQAEPLMPATLPPEAVIAWFRTDPPRTLAGEAALVAALQRSNPPAADIEIGRFWRTTVLTGADELAFLASHRAALADDHAARMDYLLAEGEWQAAERLLPLLPWKDHALAEARIALQAGRAGVDDMILSLPDDLRADPGLALDRFRWRLRAKLHDPARDLMLEQSGSAQALLRPDAWAQARVDYARAALRRGDWALARRLAANHFLPSDNRHYADLEWLAGYAALRAGDSDTALDHFAHLETVVGGPISTARSLYWQARALQAAGNDAAARDDYRAAARHQATYYGQLAAEKIGAPMDPALALAGRGDDSLPDWRGSTLRDDRRWQAALWLIAAGEADLAQRFALRIAQDAPAADIIRMARLMIEARQTHHGLRLAKLAAQKGAVFPAAYFPLTGLEKTALGVPPELVMAISRQESEFNPRAGSRVGAQGLMQLMPGTARQVATRLGVAYDPLLLGSDAAYNARLGAAYLAGLRDRFGPSVALVAAGYNAGPGRPMRWLYDFGDLRRDADPVDWVEMIPFDETRNYVMRVAEALPVYRARIAGHPVAFTPTRDLTGDGIIPPPPKARQTLPQTLTDSRPPPRRGDPLSPAAAAFDDVAPRVIGPVTTSGRPPARATR